MIIQKRADGRGLSEGDEFVSQSDEWKVTTIADDNMVVSHADGVELHIIQTKPERAVLPFEVVRKTATGDQYRIDESDWFDEAVDTARVYALGYVEADQL